MPLIIRYRVVLLNMSGHFSLSWVRVVHYQSALMTMVQRCWCIWLLMMQRNIILPQSLRATSHLMMIYFMHHDQPLALHEIQSLADHQDNGE